MILPYQLNVTGVDEFIMGSLLNIEQLEMLKYELETNQGSTRKKRQIIPFDQYPDYKWTMPVPWLYDGGQSESQDELLNY